MGLHTWGLTLVLTWRGGDVHVASVGQAGGSVHVSTFTPTLGAQSWTLVPCQDNVGVRTTLATLEVP